jgi:beta-N-acetylhexosaminidase
VTELERLARGVVFGAAPEGPAESCAAFGGVVFFARDGESSEAIRVRTDAIRAAAGPSAPLCAIDQEGGRVARLTAGVAALPSMMALGATDDTQLAEQMGEQLAFDLRRAGCTLDLAPVLDLALDPRSTVIGTRALGDDPERTIPLARAFVTGLQRGGILACGKHFPGHGSTATDTHVSQATVDAGEATLRARDLLPFAQLIRVLPAIMSGHLLVPAFDAEHAAPRSYRIATSLLRDELGFEGALLTDALEMSAVEDPLETAIACLAAGTDGLVVGRDRTMAEPLVAAIVAAVEADRLDLARLRSAFGRIARLKARSAPPLALDEFPPHPGIGRRIARCAATLVRGIAHADPSSSIVVVFDSEYADGAEQIAYRHALSNEAPVLESVRLPLDPEPPFDALIERIAKHHRRPIVLMQRAHLFARQRDAIDRIVDAFPDAVVVSTREPFDIACVPRARHLLAVYGDDRAAIDGLADVLFGASAPRGSLPVRVA